MRIFIGYGYNQRDRWVETYAIPLIEAFGCEVLHGREVYGGTVTEQVLQLIRRSDAMAGFTTRRDDNGGGTYSSHPWVLKELNAAYRNDPPIPFVEVREEGVDVSGEDFAKADYQRIEYREEDRAACLLRLAQAVRGLQEQTRVIRVRLGPESVVAQSYDLLEEPSLVCECQTYAAGTESRPRAIPILPVQGNLEVQLRGIGRQDLVRIVISARGHRWRSDYESVDTVDIQLKGN